MSGSQSWRFMDDPETKYPIWTRAASEAMLLKRLVTRQPNGVRLRAIRHANAVPIGS
jgi:hypothetical protein